jgi:hypothetical protein
MSSHPVSFPSGLTRGYSNSYVDTRIQTKAEQATSSDVLDAQQVEGGM